MKTAEDAEDPESGEEILGGSNIPEILCVLSVLCGGSSQTTFATILRSKGIKAVTNSSLIPPRPRK